MYQDVVGGGRASIILSRDVGLLRVLCGSQHPASAALKLHQQGSGELTCFLHLYMLVCQKNVKTFILFACANIIQMETFHIPRVKSFPLSKVVVLFGFKI